MAKPAQWLWGLILILAVFAVYTPVWWAGFVWDDDQHVTANPCIIGPLGLKEIWTTSAAQYYPLVLTTFWVEHALWGLNPLPYHLVNVVMQSVCAILLWRVLWNLSVPGAWLGAALWALHPLQVETVAWITEMKNTQSGVFYLLAILFFVKFLKAGNESRSYILTLVCSALALASKSSTVVLPLVLCLCAWWVEGKSKWRTMMRVAPIFLMAFIAAFMAVRTVDLQGVNIDTQWLRSWPERLITAGNVIWFYLGKLIWPHPLMFIYQRWVIDAGSPIQYLPILAVVIALLVLWLKDSAWTRPVFVVLVYFLVALLPVLGLVEHYFLRYSFVADHLQFLAGMGPLALAGAGLTRLTDILIPGKIWLRSSLCVGLLLVLGTLSWQRAGAFESDEKLWTDTLAQNPKCWMAYNNLGYDFYLQGRGEEAMDYYRKATELNSQNPNPHNNLGLAHFQKGRLDEAISEYQKAIELNPNSAEAYNNLGMALFQKGATDNAMASYRNALAINPDFAHAHHNLGNSFLTAGRVDEAIAEYQKALVDFPNFAEAHNSLGAALFQKGQVAQSIAEFQEALRLNPNNADARSNLERVQASAGTK